MGKPAPRERTTGPGYRACKPRDQNIIIARVVAEIGYGRKVVDGLNDTDKHFISILLMTVKLPGMKVYDTQMAIHTSTVNKDISL